MSEEQKYEIATKADMIVGGYAFFRKGEYITVVNLNKNDKHVMLMDKNEKIIESNMDPIEQVIAFKKWKDNKEFMENENA